MVQCKKLRSDYSERGFLREGKYFPLLIKIMPLLMFIVLLKNHPFVPRRSAHVDRFPPFVYPKPPSVDAGLPRISKPDILA